MISLTGEERDLLVRAVAHMGCNCGESECFTSDEMALAERVVAGLPITIIGRVKLSEGLNLDWRHR